MEKNVQVMASSRRRCEHVKKMRFSCISSISKFFDLKKRTSTFFHNIVLLM